MLQISKKHKKTLKKKKNLKCTEILKTTNSALSIEIYILNLCKFLIQNLTYTMEITFVPSLSITIQIIPAVVDSLSGG